MDEKFFDSSDFRNLYIAQSLFIDNKNFYNDTILKEKFQIIFENQEITTITTPGFPTMPLLYPPWAIPFFVPFSLFEWKIAVIIWFIIQFLSLLGIVYITIKLFTKQFNYNLFLESLILLLAAKFTLPELSVGQPIFFILFLAFTSLYLSSKNKWIIAGILLGISTIKFTIIIPFYLYLFFRKQYKVILISGLIPFILILLITVLYNDFSKIFYDYLTNLHIYRTEIAFNFLFLKSMMTEFGVILVHYFPNLTNKLHFIYLLLISISIFYILKKSEKFYFKDLYLFLFCSLLTLCFSYHLYYDSLILFPYFLIINTIETKWKLILVFLLLPFFLPTFTLLKYLNSTSNLLYLNHSISLLFLLIVHVTKVDILNTR